ncbi:thiamine pyrophosphate-dependent enzyme [Amycolatopsis eburnea]|uniref:Thiamine pyrophosphate enzyme TPP-binding domain-containing protein n=1 Tax=Amycolatopsis eburnea TaxID=2267691 RepID=A0A427T7K2_9PSEU|nr:thiamine pyrophosphate-dependent enzyme [Amycolatopsis eburnea]RSD16347.1 hypothetical protein EIY87_22095 [Amycolatopsis eburnea]
MTATEPALHRAPASTSRDTCHDLADVLDQQIDRVVAVAGSPVTHVAELLAARKAASFEWAINEKAAAETAIGLAAAGCRSCLITKHNGLDLALDPLMNAAVHTIGAGLVIISGDDPDAAGSTCVQDSRLVAHLAGLPAFEPALDGDVDYLVRAALELSESASIPALVKITTRMHQHCATIAAPPPPTRRPQTIHYLSGPRLDRHTAHGLTKLGRHQRHRLIAQPLAEAAFAQPGIVSGTCASPCGTAVIAVGAAAEAVPIGACCRMVVRASVPVPEAVLDFADRHEQTLVIEEPAPVLENWLRARVSRREVLLGRATGHVKPEGLISVPEVEHVLRTHRASSWTQIERKPDVVLTPGPWETLFDAVARLHRAGAFVAADVGSSVRLCYPPYNAADVALCLGSAITVAGGAARTGRRAIAVTGDFALLHTGLEGLLSTAHLQLPLLVIVLANGTQAKTGGQPLPATDIPALVQACGITTIDQWALGSLDVKATEARLSSLISTGLPAAAIVSSNP